MTQLFPAYDPDYQLPCSAAFEFITPDDAKQMLHAGNHRNRNVMKPAVIRFRGILDRREYMFDATDAIGIADDGSVVNGQHRLTTISEGNHGVWILVVRGVRKDVVCVIDQGSARNLVQTLQIHGGFADPSVTAAAVEWLYKMEMKYEQKVVPAYKSTVSQKLALLGKHPHLVESVCYAAAVHSKFTKGLSKGILTAYHYAFATVNAERAEDFYEQLATGDGVEAGTPVYALREKLNANQIATVKARDWELATYLIRAWEAFLAGRSMTVKQLKITSTGPRSAPVPTVQGVYWLGTDDAVKTESDLAPPTEVIPPSGFALLDGPVQVPAAAEAA